MGEKESNKKRFKTLVVNLFAAPGVGKTTTMSMLFSELKRLNINAEIAPEFVKEMLWEGRDIDELYVLAKQSHRLARLNGKVQVIITDRPLLLTEVYNENNPTLCKMAYEEMQKYENINYFLLRNSHHEYQQSGRFQTESESKALDGKIYGLLEKYNLPFTSVLSADDLAIEDMTSVILQRVFKGSC